MKQLAINRMDGTVSGIDEYGRRFTCTIYQNLQTGEYYFYHLRKKYKI